MKNFTSYEKTTEMKVITVKHTVRILLNASALSVKQTLDNVPNNAIVAMVVDDTELENYGEIVFEETKHQG